MRIESEKILYPETGRGNIIAAVLNNPETGRGNIIAAVLNNRAITLLGIASKPSLLGMCMS